MMQSEIRTEGGRPLLYIDGKEAPAMAYTTYFEERSCYEDFLRAGYRIFFVNLSFTALAINSRDTGFTPFDVGVFEDREREDYSEFEAAVERILAACPEAIIFPRIYVSMPRWWVESHPEEVVDTPKGGKREILFSEAFRRDGSEMLRRAIAHIKAAPYASRVAGWMLCGGNTQEWFHHDFFGSLCDNACAAYGKSVPCREEYYGNRLTEKSAVDYARFSSRGVAESLECFARTVKEETGRTQVVGSFYGYVFSVNSPLSGTHALWELLDSENLDYFCSPNCYTHGRPFGIDWSDMLPVDSVKLHGKLCFMECDIRTYLTKSVQESRPGRYPENIYPVAQKNQVSVWSGPPTAELSREALRKSFAHQIAKASGIWWFDMFGGWYHDPLLMKEIAEMKEWIAALPADDGTLSSELVFFGDEGAYANLTVDHPASRGVAYTRVAMGNIGTSYDAYLVEDAPAVLKRYKAAVFSALVPSEAGERAMALCRSLGIPFLAPTEETPVLSVEQITAFLEQAGVHRYTKEPDVVYAGNGTLSLHSTKAGEKHLLLKEAIPMKCLFGAENLRQEGKSLRFTLKENATACFVKEQ